MLEALRGFTLVCVLLLGAGRLRGRLIGSVLKAERPSTCIEKSRRARAPWWRCMLEHVVTFPTRKQREVRTGLLLFLQPLQNCLVPLNPSTSHEALPPSNTTWKPSLNTSPSRLDANHLYAGLSRVLREPLAGQPALGRCRWCGLGVHVQGPATS